MSNGWESTFDAGKGTFNGEFDPTRAMIRKSNRIPAILESNDNTKSSLVKGKSMLLHSKCCKPVERTPLRSQLQSSLQPALSRRKTLNI